jgi:hypothetical protein
MHRTSQTRLQDSLIIVIVWCGVIDLLFFKEKGVPDGRLLF